MQGSSESVGGELSEGCSSKDNYSNQVWSELWRWQWYRLLLNQGKGGYSEVDEYDNARI